MIRAPPRSRRHLLVLYHLRACQPVCWTGRPRTLRTTSIWPCSLRSTRACPSSPVAKPAAPTSTSSGSVGMGCFPAGSTTPWAVSGCFGCDPVRPGRMHRTLRGRPIDPLVPFSASTRGPRPSHGRSRPRVPGPPLQGHIVERTVGRVTVRVLRAEEEWMIARPVRSIPRFW